MLQNISAMKSNGNNGIIFGGTGKVGGSCFVGMSNNVKSPQTLFTIDIAEGGIPQQLPMYLATAAIALLHQKNIPHVNMLKALQSLLADKRKTLVEVTSNYAIMTSGSFLEQVSYDENNWSTGRFILLYAGKRPNIFSDGSVLQKEERDKSSFYFFPTKFILAESDSIAGGLSEVRPGAGMVSADLSSALAPSESDPEEEQEELILSSHGRVAVLPTDDKSLEEGNAADDMDPLEASIVSTALVASEGEDKEGVLLGDSSGSLLADSPALMQSILGVSSGAPESGMTVSDEVQQQISTLVDTFVVQDDEEPAQDLSAKDDDGKKKKKKKKAARDTKA